MSNALLFVYGLLPLALGVLWALTPETAFGPAKEPYLFPLNLRYGMPGFALILAGAALCTYLRKPDARGWWLRIVVACSLAHVVAAVVTNSPNIPSAWTFSAGVLAGGGVVVLAWLARRLPRGVRRPALAAYVCIAVAGAFAAGTWILHPSRSYALGLDLVDVAAPIADSRSPVCVAYSTSVKRSYPLYGERLQNRVLLAGREAAPGTYGRFTRPKQLVRFLQDNRCSYFVTKDDSLDGPHGTSDNDLRLINSLLARHADPLFRAGVMAMYDRFERTPEYAWAAGMPATFEPVRQSGAYVLYRFHDDE